MNDVTNDTMNDAMNDVMNYAMKGSVSRFFLSAAVTAVSLLAGGCVEETVPDAGKADGLTAVTLKFNPGKSADSVTAKSSLFNGDTVSDINLYVWRDGVCICHEFIESDAGEFRIQLVSGAEYSFYALANCGERIEPDGGGWDADESSMDRLKIRFPDIDGGVRNIPMAAALKDRSVSGVSYTIDISLVRLVSRIVFSYVPDGGLDASGISITGIRLCDAAMQMSPFSERSKAADSDVADGDFGSAEDLGTINGGGSIEFYAFENCWGDLLAGNTDQKKKVPEEVGNITGPTYIEVSCAFSGDGLLLGEITYRIYLGADAVGNFDLTRNSSYRIQLLGSKNGLDEISWRIDKDISYNDYLVKWEIARGAHGQDNLYLGEMFLGRLSSIDPSVIAYFGTDLGDMAENCTVRCIGYASGEPENDPIAFSPPEIDGDGVLTFTGTCRKELSGGTLWLCDASGKQISRISAGLNVKIPKVVFSSEDSASVPVPASGSPEATINGNAAGIRVYLCDSDGRNLLADDGKGYGVDADVFNVRVIDTGSRWPQVKGAGGIETYMTNLYEGGVGDMDGQPFCDVNLKMTNSGKSAAANRELWNMVAASGCLNIGIADQTHALLGTKAFDVGYAPFDINFYDKAYGGKTMAAKYGISSPFFFTVSNPSNMSFNFSYLALTQRGRANNTAIGKSTTSGTDIFFYDCPSGISLPESVYMLRAEASIYSNSSGEFSSCTMTRADDGTVIIGLNRTFYELLNAARTTESLLTYSRYGYYDSELDQKSYGFYTKNGITVMVDFSSQTGGALSYGFCEMLENGGAESDYIYSYDYDFRGTSHYSGNVYKGHSHGETARVYKSYGDLTPTGISTILERKRDISLSMQNATSSYPYYLMKSAGVMGNASINAKLTCKGFCLTHVNGQKKGSQDNSSETSYSISVTGSSKSAGSYSLAPAGINLLFSRIYNTTYDDSEKNYMKGTPWQHHAHPTEVILGLEFKRTSTSGDWYIYDFASYTPVNLTYDNSGYHSTYDENPYTVSTAVDWETTHGKFSHKIIMVQ